MGNFSFAQVPVADIMRSVFNRTHGHKTTFDVGTLIPFYVDEVLPGDTFEVDASIFARLATPKVPLMDGVHLDVFFFAVPNRLLWENWQKFMGEQENPGDSTDYVVPVVEFPAGIATGDLADYFGLPIDVAGIEANALFFRAYNLIWNEWFRDQNLQDRLDVPKDDGPDDVAGYVVRRRAKKHDYFTSCLPWPQKGPGVELPLGTSAPVDFSGSVLAVTGDPIFTNGSAAVTMALDGTNWPSHVNYTSPSGNTLDGTLGWSNPGLGLSLAGVADLSQAAAATINSLRQAFQVQKLLERDARGGTRYTEILRSHFGVVSPDSRLQRPEFLGGGSVPMIVNPVAQTSSTDATTPQGNLSAYGVAGGSRLGFSKSFVEHCVVIGLVNARTDISYQQGIHRMFSRSTRYDFYWPAFAHLGEQAVLNKEIFAQGTGDDDAVFGYQERWAEYRYAQSKVTGVFRSAATGSLDMWHLSDEYTALPALNSTFIVQGTEMDRCVAVPSEPHILFDSHIRVKATRPMPTYSVPGLVDHF